LDLLPAEKMLAQIDPGYQALEVAARLDSHLSNGHLHFVQYNADSPTGAGYADALAGLFYDLPPVKELRKKYNLTRTGSRKHLLQALLKSYKQFGGSKKPNIAIVEFRPAYHSGQSEYELFRDFFRDEGHQVEIVSPEQLEYRNGVLRKGSFEINLIYRRLGVQEFLIRFGLNDLTDLPKVEDMAEALGLDAPILIEQSPSEDMLPLDEPEEELEDEDDEPGESIH